MEILKQIQIHRTALEKLYPKQKTVKQINDYTEALVHLCMLEEMIKKFQIKEIGYPILIKVYEEYIELISEENSTIAPIAANHGWLPDEIQVSKGKELRAKIAKIKASV